MRNNYESLRQSQQVVSSFSMACAEALQQLGLPLRRERRLCGGNEHDIVVGIRDGAAAVEDAPPPPLLFLDADSPLYGAPIAFPPAPVDALLLMTGAPKCSSRTEGGDLLLATMESDSSGGSSTGAEKNAAASADDLEHIAVWGAITPGLEEVIASLQNVDVADIVRLMETVTYFKWVKDEEVLGWRNGSEAARLRMDVSALHAAVSGNSKATAATTQHPADVGELRLAVERAAETFIDRIPRIDRVGMATQAAAMDSAASSLAPHVHVIDLMLNVLIRVCLWQWPGVAFGDQTFVVLLCTFPWFVRDLSVEAASWMTYFHLRALMAGDMGMSHQQTFLYVQRLRRLCWPAAHDVDSALVRKLFLLEKAPAEADGDDTGPNDVGEAQEQLKHQSKVQKTRADIVPSFRETVCILYGSFRKQRVAYELLLLWLKHAHPADLHRTSPHSHYISATGVTISDIDRFVTERLCAKQEERQWVLLRASVDNAAAAAAVEHLTQCCQTPYVLTRLFMCSYHNVLPHIWQSIGARRRNLLWAAWLRGVAKPLVNVVLMNPTAKEKGAWRFLEPLIVILTSDVIFLRLITRLVIVSLVELCSVGNSQPLEESCTRLIEVVYIGALVLHCSTDTASSGGDLAEAASAAAAAPVAAGVSTMDGRQQQPTIVAIRRPFKEAVSTLVRELGSEHVPMAQHLLEALFELESSNAVRTEVPQSIKWEVLQICDEESHNMVKEWLSRRASLAQEPDVPLEEPLLREWHQAVQGADAGLSVPLPDLLECCRRLLGLLKKRHGPLVAEQHQQLASAAGDTKATTAVFTAGELQVVLSVLSRAILSRIPSTRVLGVPSIAHEVASLTSSTNGDVWSGGSSSSSSRNNSSAATTSSSTSSTNSNSVGRKDQEAQTAVVVADAATDRVVLLEKVLSVEVTAKAHELPFTSLLEAIMLHLVPYSTLQIPYNTLHEGRGQGCAHWHALVQQLEKSIQTRRHYRLTCNLVLFRCYAFAAPQDQGWQDGAPTRRTSHQDCDGTAASNIESRLLQKITCLLLKALVRSEMKHSVLQKNKKLAVAADVVAATEQEPEARLEQVERILGCHALAAYMRLGSSAPGPLSLRDAYEVFLHRGAEAAARIAGPHNDSDLLFLWLAASATVVGVHFHPARVYTWPITGGSTASSPPGESGGEVRCTSVEERTARLVCDLAPYVQTELLRTSPRLKFVVNTVVALQAFGRLGINIDASSLNLDQLLQRASADRRLLHRHLNLFLIGCSALPSTRQALLNTASYLREVRNILSPAEIARAFVAITLSANAFAKQHEAQADLQQHGNLLDVAHSTAPTMRVTPTQLRHAWSALARRVLEFVEEVPTHVLVKGVECAGAVACVDTLVYQQLLSVLVEFRQDELSLLHWVVMLRTARQSFENQREFGEYLRQPLQSFLLALETPDAGACAQVQQGQQKQDDEPNPAQLGEELCLFVEALPELFMEDAEFWGLLRRALRVQWMTHFNDAGASEQQQEAAAMWLQELTKSYAWALRTAGHHDLSDVPIL
ncbi:hypothetical protein DQ04_06851000 [Trypanosoma grayi]|uniref:hypothetical protein n=1 Tax=Trypanosoma grayi TaxID=71804 RepID=UPI0004F433A2|nr:hypothetical protein DQ04_06851000 [Trypanosoma grayi]KEG08589.1 hypothetical protein DQ04_06851000 [Trypanosoma grayi]